MSELKPADVAETILTIEEMDRLNIHQLGLPECAPTTRAVCPDADDEHHYPLAGLKGLLIANRRGFMCPICGYDVRFGKSQFDLGAIQASSVLWTTKDPRVIDRVRAMAPEFDRIKDMNANATTAYSILSCIDRFAEARTKDFQKLRNGPKIEGFPVSFLIQLHNAFPRGAEGRELVLNMLRIERMVTPRQHWLEALAFDENGDLKLDQARYDRACWRGKQETYYSGAAKHLEQLRSDLNMVVTFQKEEDAADLALAPMETLFDERPVLQQVAALKSVSAQFELLTRAIRQADLPELAQAVRADSPLLSVEQAEALPASVPPNVDD